MYVEEKLLGENLRLLVVPDEDPWNPRECQDNLGRMVCWHRRYSLGDEQPALDPEEWGEQFDWDSHIVLPLYLLDHSGLWMTTSPGDFRRVDPAGWDWGQVGWIYAPASGEMSPGEIERALRHEVEEYSRYLSGDIYCVLLMEHCPCCSEWRIREVLGGIRGWERVEEVLESPEQYFELALNHESW